MTATENATLRRVSGSPSNTVRIASITADKALLAVSATAPSSFSQNDILSPRIQQKCKLTKNHAEKQVSLWTQTVSQIIASRSATGSRAFHPQFRSSSVDENFDRNTAKSQSVPQVFPHAVFAGRRT